MTQNPQPSSFLSHGPPKGPFYSMSRLQGNDSNSLPLGTIRTSDLKKNTDPLELASTLVDSYIKKDSKYPEIGGMSLRMYFSRINFFSR